MRFDAATTILIRFLVLILAASLTCGMAQAAANLPPRTLESASAATAGAQSDAAAVRQPVAPFAEPKTPVTRTTDAPETACGAGSTDPPARYTLSLTGTGGSVAVDGSPHELPWSETYDAGTTLLLEAVPDCCHVFWAWDFGDRVHANPISVTMDSDKQGTAHFCLSQHTLNFDGAHGSIRVDGALYPLPWSISCICGSTVTLAAVPDAGYRFVGWSGDITADQSPTTILVDSGKEIVAHFTAITGWPSIHVTGDGSGTVLVDGVEHPLPCSVPCDERDTVTLEARPGEGHIFVSWSGDLAGAGNPTTITMDDEKHVSAHFDITSCSIYVNARGEGTVALDGATLQLPWTECRLWGTMLTLEAVPAPDRAFHGWSGAIASDENPVTIRLDGDTHVWADFEGLFTDVPACHWAYEEIRACAAADIVQGYNDGSFQPDIAVDRAAMAVFLSRALCGGDRVPPGPRIPSFSDVPSWYWAYDCVEHLKSSGAVAGYCQRSYSPGAVVKRDQMAVFLAQCRANHAGEDGLADFLPPPEPTFADVPPLFWARRHIEHLAQEDIVGGYPDGNYEPAQHVSRAQTAVFAQRAFELPVCFGSDGKDAAPGCAEAAPS
jgi:hypothetical protein